jgi:alkylation response protein AidB-like acyl-CoA dehydrogenase
MLDYASIDSSLGQDFYGLDPDLQAIVRRECAADDLPWADEKLHEFGTLIGEVVAPNAEVIDRNPPRLVRWDRWANEVGEVEHHPAALESKRALWKAGYVSGFTADSVSMGRPFPPVARAAAGYLLCQADTGLSCSLGMTGGVAGLVDAYAPADVRDGLLAGLRNDDLDRGIDGSMFLTERDGGSDLGATVRCTARDIGDGRVLINGEKWFCSNIDGAAIVMLARPEGAPEGPSGLGLYLVPKFLEDGSRNHITMRRLKEKLGTRSVPTGEVEFHDALGYALRPRRSAAGDAIVQSSSDAGGLARMMEMVNGSRLGVAFMGLGIARRAFLESAIWAHHRRAKGRLLVDLPLVREQLVDLLCTLEASAAIGFECSTSGRRAGAELLRRILIPAAKVRLCRFGVRAASFAVELHGGNGYCEDWGLTRQLRDAQCHPIWEGSENICALDVLRSLRRERAGGAVLARVDEALATAAEGPAFVADAAVMVGAQRGRLAQWFDAVDSWEGDRAEASSGRLTELLADVVSAALLLEHGVDDPRKALVAVRFTRTGFGDRDGWDAIAANAGREMLAYADIDETFATKAAA